MCFYKAKEKQQERERLREFYLMRGVQLMVEYTAGFVGGRQGLADWEDVVRRKEQDAKSGDEIAADVFKRAGLRIG